MNLKQLNPLSVSTYNYLSSRSLSSLAYCTHCKSTNKLLFDENHSEYVCQECNEFEQWTIKQFEKDTDIHNVD
jgi:hypothetical protein